MICLFSLPPCLKQHCSHTNLVHDFIQCQENYQKLPKKGMAILGASKHAVKRKSCGTIGNPVLAHVAITEKLKCAKMLICKVSRL